MVDFPKEDELTEYPLAVDMADLSEGPIILDTMVWISTLEPRAQFELCLLSFLQTFLDQLERRKYIH